MRSRSNLRAVCLRRRELEGGTMKRCRKGMLIASAAASLLLSGAVVAQAADKAGGEVHCGGVNACKGQGACASAQNSCKGQNACKGKGFVNMSGADECTKAGGKIIEPKGAPKS
jgi:hypothetical protein